MKSPSTRPGFLTSLLAAWAVLSSCAAVEAMVPADPPGELVARGVWVLKEVDAEAMLSRVTIFVRTEEARLVAAKGGQRLFALETVPSIAGRHPGAIAALNADFFEPDRSPTGFFANERGIWRGPWLGGRARGVDRGILAFDANGTAAIGAPFSDIHVELGDGTRFPIAVNVVQPAERRGEEAGAPFAIVYTSNHGESAPAFSRESRAYRLTTDGSVWMPNSPLQATVTARLSASGRSELGLTSDTMLLYLQNPDVGELEVGTTVTLHAPLPMLDGAVPAGILGGLPLIVSEGRNIALERSVGEAFPARVAATRQPRSAVGLRHEGRELVLVAWDGRHAERAGATLPELADYFISLGCTEALNFDGGGSTVLVVNGGIANHPSDIRAEGATRPVGNALLILPLN